MHIYNLKVVLKLKAMQITQNYGKKIYIFLIAGFLQDLQDSPWHAWAACTPGFPVIIGGAKCLWLTHQWRSSSHSRKM